MSDYAWIITRDHLAEEFGDMENEVGITGPRAAPDDLLALVKADQGHVFYLYDDDGIKYYTGRLITSGDMDDEDHCYAPLRDFGMPNAGCTEVRWHGHKEWDCG